MSTKVEDVRRMVGHFVAVVGCTPPHEAAILHLARKMAHLSEIASKKTFRSMSSSWKFKDFPRPADWSGVIEQAYTIDESAKKVDEFMCKPEDRPDDGDWEAFSAAVAGLADKFSIPDEPKTGYMSPEECMVGWQNRQDELNDAIRHLDGLGLIGDVGGKKTKQKR